MSQYPTDAEAQAYLLALALTLAAEVHATHTDRAGQPYLGHIHRVVANCQTPFEKTCAALHDVVEDSPLTLADLARHEFPKEVLSVLDALTRREHESYDAYMSRVISEPRAWRIKLADLTDNMDLRRLPSLAPADFERLQRYHRAFTRLTALASAALSAPPNDNA